MASQSTANHERETRADESAESDVLPRVKRAFDDGSAALLAGVTLLLGTLRARERGGRAALRGVVGLALIWLGLQQRQADDGGILSIEADEIRNDDVSAEAEAGATMPLHDIDQQAKGNPRDVSKEPDVETDEDEGDIQFSREQETGPRQEPDLNEEGIRDTRQTDEMDDEADVEIDISKAAMADEPNEAAGPTSAQARPTTTKDENTVPEDEAPVTGDAADKQVDLDDGSEDEDDVTDPGDDPNEEPADSEEQSNSRLEDDESETES